MSDFRITVVPEAASCVVEEPHQGSSVARIKLPTTTSIFEYRTSFVFCPYPAIVEGAAVAAPQAVEPLGAEERAASLRSQEFGPAFSSFVERVLASKASDESVVEAALREIPACIQYGEREEQGILLPEETIERGAGSCRDMAVLLMHVLRRSGIPTRFVSGYLISEDRGSYWIDFHAWCEVYVDGGGWRGIDPTSGDMIGAFHIPLARANDPANAGALEGLVEMCVPTLQFEMKAEVLEKEADGGTLRGEDDTVD